MSCRAVVVEVDEGDAGAHGLRQQFLAERAITVANWMPACFVMSVKRTDGILMWSVFGIPCQTDDLAPEPALVLGAAAGAKYRGTSSQGKQHKQGCKLVRSFEIPSRGRHASLLIGLVW